MIDYDKHSPIDCICLVTGRVFWSVLAVLTVCFVIISFCVGVGEVIDRIAVLL